MSQHERLEEGTFRVWRFDGEILRVGVYGYCAHLDGPAYEVQYASGLCSHQTENALRLHSRPLWAQPTMVLRDALDQLCAPNVARLSAGGEPVFYWVIPGTIDLEDGGDEKTLRDYEDVFACSRWIEAL